MKERGGEAGISQIDEEILFGERLIDKCRHEHKGGHVNHKLEGVNGRREEILSGQ